jgi:acetyl-CoA synthetase
MLPLIQSFEAYQEAYQKSITDPEGFWAEIAQSFQWKKTWDKILNWNFTEPKVEWFLGGKLNITENCLDRHMVSRSEQTAILWEPNDPKDAFRKISYGQLFTEVKKFSNVLLGLGIKKGDRVCIYMLYER